MIREISGPDLRLRVEYLCFKSRYEDARRSGMATYAYIDDEGRRMPEYAATRIKIKAFYTTMSDALVHQLATELAQLPGCLETTKITGHKTLRPQVVAIFDRKAAAA